MFNVEKYGDDKALVLKLSGKLNSATAQEFKDVAFGATDSCEQMTLDFSDLQYVASAGLRVILEIHKTMSAKGKSLILINVDEGTKEIFQATGLSRFLTIK